MRSAKTWSILISCVLGFVAYAQAHAQDQDSDVYVYPIQYLSPELNARSDIKLEANRLKVKFHEAPRAELATFEVESTRLTFFKEIHTILSDMTSYDPATPVPADATAEACAAHHSLGSLVIPQIHAEQAQCQDLPLLLRETFSNYRDYCDFVFLPESFVRNHPPGLVDPELMTTLEGLIETAGEPLYHFRAQIPAYFKTPEFLGTMRPIIAKIRSNQLISGLHTQLLRLKNVATALEQRPSCFDSSQQANDLATHLPGLAAELRAGQLYLTQLVSDGLAQADADRKPVEALGRQRRELPYPSLTDRERQLLSMYLGAIFWRMRGGGLLPSTRGTQAAREQFARLPLTAITDLNGGNGRVIGEALFRPLQIRGWSSYQDMGTTGGDKYSDLAGMTDRGRFQISFANLILEAGSALVKVYDTGNLILGGEQMGPCYFYGWNRLANFTIQQNHELPLYRSFIDGPTGWGEACTGAAIGLGLSKMLLLGKK